MARLSLSLLGPFEVTLDGVPATAFDSNKVRALLTYLAVEAGRPHARDALAGLLWPDRSARTNLRNALANLRAARGNQEATPPYLLVTRETIQFNQASDCQLDVAAFRALVEADGPQAWEEALTLYRGPFLEGLAVGDSAAFDHWALRAREQFEWQVLDVLGHLVTQYEARGEVARALDHARRQVGLAPWQE
jgi:DNA-binding SARP family transcriptional activator